MHDCLDYNCKFWSPEYKGQRTIDGKKCYGYMDYFSNTNYWSPCSVSDFSGYINRQLGGFCLEKIIPDIDNSGPPTGPVVCNNIKLTTTGLGRVVAWEFGSCFSQVEYLDYDTTYWHVKYKE